MPRRTTDDDWDDDESSWDESWTEGGEEDDEDSTIPCPHCRRDIYEDAPRCPYCERYLSPEDSPRDKKPLWIVVGVLVCLLLIYLTLFH